DFRLSPVFTRDSQDAVRLGFAFLSQNRRGVASRLDSWSGVTVCSEEKSQIIVIATVSPSDRRSHVDNPSDQLILLILGVGRVSLMNLGLPHAVAVDQ